MACMFIRNFRPYCKHREGVIGTRPIGKKIGFKSFTSETTTNSSPSEVTVNLANGNTLSFSSGKLAKFADGCALVTYKNTTVVATVVSKDRNNSRDSFVPLTVSYHQKAAALGRIPLNFLRRDFGQSESEIITSRLIDRSIRPLFPSGFNWETQIICSPLAVDGSNFPDVLGINAASAALATSNVPWDGPVGAVRVGLVNGLCVVNPTKLELAESKLNLVMTTRGSKIVTMIEGVASNIIQNDLFKCIKTGAKECEKIIAGITALQSRVGKTKREFNPESFNPELQSAMESMSVETLRDIFQTYTHDKTSRDEAIFKLQTEVMENLKKEFSEEDMASGQSIFSKICKTTMRDLIFETEIRCDGRSPHELRKINCEVDLFEPLHGSALFQRGQTQVFCTVTLDSPNSALKTDRVSMLTSGVKEKNFFVHYEFPPFATNETGRTGPIGRREIGHGVLAEKALRSNIPENFPFTIRLTSEVLESNGSSSMATVCGGTLALWDAGVPLLNPCAGVAMGLVTKCDENNEISQHKILTDLLGIEDYLGEMDFKIAGTKKSYTAFQMDVKNRGVPVPLVFEILSQGKEAIGKILQIMRETSPEVRLKKKSNWPEKSTVSVPIHLRSKLLGPGGISLKNLEMTTGVELTETVVGEFSVFAPNADALAEAKEIMAKLLKDSEEVSLEFGAVYMAQIVEVRDTGCMVTLHSSMRPVFIPLSQLDVRQVSHPSALGLERGQEIKVKYFGRDPVSGLMRLSRKILMGPASEVARQLHKVGDVQFGEESNQNEEESSNSQKS